MNPLRSRNREYLFGLYPLLFVLAIATMAIFAVQPPPAMGDDAATAKADDDQNPHLWQPRTRSVAVFKNGLGFFMREGEVQLRDGWCVASHIPPAAFGTLAIYAHDKKETVDIVGSGPGEVVEFDGRDAPDDTKSKRARLETSKNLNV